ncbi:unnamed protein product, partial [Lymnaea stagnalis]
PPSFAFAVSLAGNKGVRDVSEEEGEKSLIGIVELKVQSEGPRKEVSCTSENSFLAIEPMGPDYFKLELKQHLDREVQSEYSVNVTCTYHSAPPLADWKIFTLRVTDENDNAPVFSETIYVGNVTEEASVGEFVLEVKATDADEGVNGAVTYFMKGLENFQPKPFAIDEKSGRITTNVTIDRETVTNFTFTVVAVDHGKPEMTGSAVVIVHVDDVNDNAPVVVTKNLRILENLDAMSLVGTLRGSDLDIGKNAELVFAKLDGDSDSSSTPFLVKSNGSVWSVVSLDREQRSLYSMAVTVRDKGQPRRSGTAVIQITVDDVNDNPPAISSPCLTDGIDFFLDTSYYLDNETLYSGSGFVVIDWHCPEGERVVYQAEASDKDSGDTARLTYGLDDGLEDALFQIDKKTGSVTLKRYVRPDDSLSQLVNISVTDHGVPRLTSYCALNITINIDRSALQPPPSTSVFAQSSN